MRLGARRTKLTRPDCKTCDLYGASEFDERHRCGGLSGDRLGERPATPLSPRTLATRDVWRSWRDACLTCGCVRARRVLACLPPLPPPFPLQASLRGQHRICASNGSAWPRICRPRHNGRAYGGVRAQRPSLFCRGPGASRPPPSACRLPAHAATHYAPPPATLRHRLHSATADSKTSLAMPFPRAWRAWRGAPSAVPPRVQIAAAQPVAALLRPHLRGHRHRARAPGGAVGAQAEEVKAACFDAHTARCGSARRGAAR